MRIKTEPNREIPEPFQPYVSCIINAMQPVNEP